MNYAFQLGGLIVALLSVMTPFIIAFIKGIKAIRKQNGLIIDKVEGLSITVVNMSREFRDYKFAQKISSVVKSETTKILNFSKSLRKNQMDSIVFHSKLLTELFQDYWYSENRNNIEIISIQLESDMSSLRTEFNQYLTQNFRILKVKKYDIDKELKLDFKTFIDESNLKDRMGVLTAKLIDNGYNHDLFITDIKKFISVFYERYIKLINEWNELKQAA